VNIEFQNIDSKLRGYAGLGIDEPMCRAYLKGVVKDNLLDRAEWQHSLSILKALRDETGFNASEELFADIQFLEEEHIIAQNFRVGEAYAEIILEQEFSCRFHWNENRDARNPKGNKTGADLVGFIETDGQVLFLFGEVKTSSETANRPPQVMTSKDGIEKQLRDLYSIKEKRTILISYLQNKARLFPDGHQFKEDLKTGIRAYYSNDCSYYLVGVLVRDVEPHEKDVSVSYERLKTQILEPKGLRLLALYLPIQQTDWVGIINEM
jgi:hypothetical protein